MDFSLPSLRVVRVLENLIRRRGMPEVVVRDKGPGFTSSAFDQWRHGRGITHHLIKPGMPIQNGTCERFNGRSKRENRNANWFRVLAEARQVARGWQGGYNHPRPHKTRSGSIPRRGLRVTGLSSDRLRLPPTSPATPPQSTRIPHKYRAYHGGNVSPRVTVAGAIRPVLTKLFRS